MNRIVRLLRSPVLTLCCLLSLAALVTAGTLYQVDHGIYAARERFFNSWFLFALPFVPVPGVRTVLAALLVNLAASVPGRLRFRLEKTGLLLAHAGVLVLVCGAGLSAQFAREAAVTLHEGERAAAGSYAVGLKLPVEIELLSFSMSVHPGTGTAKSYQSRVRMRGEGIDHETVISMNRPFRLGPFSFYQTAYDVHGGRYSSTLSVVYNPLRFMPYAASVIIMAGLLLHFGTAFGGALLALRRESRA
ncbi:MAG: cytochrome c biogenesis protein ResB [Chitinispirillaceae bacterium]|nr:cytochrome c biogenesis protein ResB [Chitinispirillaceae bacterium]